MKMTIGSDPELFLEDVQGLRSAIGYTGGTKAKPVTLGNRPGFFIQEDNVALEFNIPPAETVEDFVESISWALSEIEHNFTKFGMRPRLSAAELFPAPELEHPMAKMFGCDPDFNAWNRGRVNLRPRDVPKELRSCGGHVHVAIDKKLRVLDIIRMMDLYLGVTSVLMDPDKTRRQLYGKAGSFRPTRYNITSCEYRVLSNFWLMGKAHMAWVFNQTKRAVERVIELDKKVDSFFHEQDLGKRIQTTINESDFDGALILANDHRLECA